MRWLSLSLHSMRNRRLTVALTVLSITLSLILLLGVERMRTEARERFANTLSSTDLVVGARSGEVQLLLYAIFRIGNPTSNLSWGSYETLQQHPDVAWTVPLSLGDSHRGFRVLGTNTDYFQYYRFGQKQPLTFTEGAPFNEVFDAVLGADVARELGYAHGAELILSHGTGDVSFVEHADRPFKVVGILAKTGTPVDRTVHVSLEGIEAIHKGWANGRPTALASVLQKRDAKPKPPASITAAMVGLRSRLATFRVQRYVNEFKAEPLMAVMPGVALQSLWDSMALAQQALMGISVMVVLVGITGMATALLTSLNERRREMAVLRSVGARPVHIFALIEIEAALILAASMVLSMLGLYALQGLLAPLVQQQWGLYLPWQWPSMIELALLGAAGLCGLIVGLIPGYRAYRYSLADGLTVRV